MNMDAAVEHRQRLLTGALVTAMTLSMLPLFLLGTLGSRVIEDLGVDAALLGVLVAAGFAVAAAVSLPAGPMVDAVGARRCLIVLFVVSAVALGVFAVAPSYPVLLAGITVSGLAQALANPVTNRLIATRVAAERRGPVMGWKQSGVQFGAFVAGVPAAVVAAATNWRCAVAVGAAVSVLGAAAGFLLARDPNPAHRPSTLFVRPGRRAARLGVFSVLLGCGLSAINTYLAMYGNTELGMADGMAAGSIAVLGVAGIVGRVWWTRRSAALGDPALLLGPLAVGSAAAAGLIAGAEWVGSWVVWVGVVGIGGCAVAANAVSMMAVITGGGPEQVGRDSAAVSAGFFSGFVIGPPVFGAAVHAGSYGVGWSIVAGEFVTAAVVAWWQWQRATR